jgi:hypothetical protein
VDPVLFRSAQFEDNIMVWEGYVPPSRRAGSAAPEDSVEASGPPQSDTPLEWKT